MAKTMIGSVSLDALKEAIASAPEKVLELLASATGVNRPKGPAAPKSAAELSEIADRAAAKRLKISVEELHARRAGKEASRPKSPEDRAASHKAAGEKARATREQNERAKGNTSWGTGSRTEPMTPEQRKESNLLGGAKARAKVLGITLEEYLAGKAADPNFGRKSKPAGDDRSPIERSLSSRLAHASMNVRDAETFLRRATEAGDKQGTANCKRLLKEAKAQKDAIKFAIETAKSARNTIHVLNRQEEFKHELDDPELAAMLRQQEAAAE